MVPSLYDDIDLCQKPLTISDTLKDFLHLHISQTFPAYGGSKGVSSLDGSHTAFAVAKKWALCISKQAVKTV